MSAEAEGAAEHRPHEERGGEDAAGAADRHRQARRHDLAEQEGNQEADGVLAVDRVFEHRVADPVHLRQDEEHGAEQEPAGRRPQPFGPAPDPVGQVLGAVEGADEGDPDRGGEQAEDRVERVLGHRDDVEAGQTEEGGGAEGELADRGRDHGAEHDEAEGAGLEVAQDQLEGEEDAGDRSVEGGADAARRAAGDEQAQVLSGEAAEPAGGRADRRADLDDRALAPDRAAGADAEGRGQGLDDRDPAADAALVAMDGEHHLGHAVPTGLGREAGDQRAVEQAPDHGDDQDHEGAEQRQVRVAEVPERAGIFVPAEQLGEADDQVAEGDRAEAGTGAGEEREGNQQTRFAAKPLAHTGEQMGRRKAGAALDRRRHRPSL